jgi:hypothetical protein
MMTYDWLGESLLQCHFVVVEGSFPITYTVIMEILPPVEQKLSLDMFSHTKKILNIFAFLSHRILFNISGGLLHLFPGRPSEFDAGHCTPPFFIILHGVACTGRIAQQDMFTLFFSWRLSFALWHRLFPVALSLLHDGAVFSYGVFSFAYITIPAISKQKGKITPTQSNGAI